MANSIIKPLHGLRGAAALTVVVGHLAPIKSAPSLGVVLFFVLSGFLIGKLYLEQDFTKAAVWQYLVARVARVYPLFAVVVVGAGLLNALIPSAEIFGLNLQRVPEHLLLVGTASTIWTVSVEFQFYGLFVGIWFLRSKASSASVVLLPVLAFAVGSAVWLGAGAGRADILGYLHIFVSGVLLSRLLEYKRSAWQRSAGLIAPFLCLAYFVTFMVVPRLYNERFIYLDPVALTICVALLGAVVLSGETWLSRFFSLPIMYWLGEISFSVYLLHRIAEWMVLYVLPGCGLWLRFVLMLTLTLMLAQAANIFIERPARDALRKVGMKLQPDSLGA